ncbi:MAG: bifunctional UDP-N-acetylglucosamine diphosphorylase/glucosamine-1-phosphate N-acetyltransferase GlmU [Atopobiaceae bacterium]
MPFTAIVLAAGEGTRMKSRHPKVMHNVMDKPLVWWCVRHARQAGATRVIVVVGNGADEVRDFFAHEPVQEGEAPVEFVEQTERLGTGHAVRVVRDAIGGFSGPVLVMAGDTPLITPETLRSLVEERNAQKAACTVLTMTPDDCTGYGRVVLDDKGQVTAIIEHKDCTPEQQATLKECNSATYCFCGKRLAENLDKIGNDNAQGEYYLPDMIKIFVSEGEPVGMHHAPEASEVLGVNNRAQLAEVTKVLRRRINHELMLSGVSMLDPDQVWVGADVKVGQDTVLMPQTFLFGHTTVGCDCTIGPNSRLTNATVGNNCTVDESILVDSAIDDDVNCGPRAYLRGHTHLLKGAKAGTHVELKNSVVGEGSKVPHLSYIGDCTMGANVNIGGGSITCNYDGKHKSHTTIGAHVFVGSDTMMVAPVTIGENALVGASSCITHDVPAGALSLERSQQVIKEDWANRYWERLKEED